MRFTTAALSATLGAFSVSGCDNPVELQVGAVRITLASAGPDLDPDGYRIRIDQGAETTVSANGAIVIGGLTPGSRVVYITDFAQNCTLAGSNSRRVTIVASDTIDVTFQVTCVARIGFYLVQPASSGTDPDPDGYTVSVDGGETRQLGPNGASLYDSTSVGLHSVTLAGLANNCSVANATINVEIQFRTTAYVQHLVSCRARVGSLLIRTTTSGTEQDTDGYDVVIDDADSYGVAPSNGSMVVDNVREGTRSVRLAGVAANCSVSANPQVVSVAYMATTELTFSVTCMISGRVRAAVTTSGVDADAAYVIRVQGNSYDESAPVFGNGSAILSGMGTGAHTVTLEDVAVNCAVSAGTPSPRTVNVTMGSTTDVAFEVSCAQSAVIAFAYQGAMSTDIGAAKVSASAVTPLTSNGAEEQDPEYSPDGSKIAYRSSRDGNLEIYVSNADGSNPVRLTNHVADDVNPAWSPDGSKIAFRSNRDGNDEIYVMNSDGSGVARLTNHPAFDAKPTWSPDGGKIAFMSDRDPGGTHIWVMNTDGSSTVALTRGNIWDGLPAWSPDGNKIAFVRYFTCYDSWYYYTYRCSNIVVMNADGTDPVRLESAQYDGEPTWSPDGKWIAFESGSCGYYYCNSNGIWAMRADGSGRTRLLNGEFYNPTWKP